MVTYDVYHIQSFQVKDALCTFKLLQHENSATHQITFAYHSAKMLEYASVLSDTGDRKYIGTPDSPHWSRCPDKHSNRSKVTPDA